jgi:hypothetical protein
MLLERPEGVEIELRHVEKQELLQPWSSGNRAKVMDTDAVEMHTTKAAAAC